VEYFHGESSFEVLKRFEIGSEFLRKWQLPDEGFSVFFEEHSTEAVAASVGGSEPRWCVREKLAEMRWSFLHIVKEFFPEVEDFANAGADAHAVVAQRHC